MKDIFNYRVSWSACDEARTPRGDIERADRVYADSDFAGLIVCCGDVSIEIPLSTVEAIVDVMTENRCVDLGVKTPWQQLGDRLKQ